MQKQNKISFPYAKSFLLGLLFCSIASFEVLAQEERNEVVSDSHSGYDNVSGMESQDLAIFDNKSAKTKDQKKPADQQKEVSEEQLYKQGGEKEVNKEGMSTLSFNLFLYVVDKFKEKEDI